MLEDMTCLIRALKTISSKVSCHVAGGLHVQLRVFAIIFLFSQARVQEQQFFTACHDLYWWWWRVLAKL